MPAEAKKFNFESAIKALEKVVQTMEQGDLSLEDSLQYFENGIQLTRQCQQSLQKAEQKVSKLMEKDGQWLSSQFGQDQNDTDEQ